MSDIQQRMNGAITALKQEFASLRTGRATTDLLNSVMVDAYGSKMPINQVGNINVAEARLLTVQVWDGSLVLATEKGIRDAGLGLNPQVDGQLIRIPLPELNEQRRAELVKLAKKYAEDARIALRNVRRDGMDGLKTIKDEEGEDAHKRATEALEKEVAGFVAQVDALLANKEKDITTV